LIFNNFLLKYYQLYKKTARDENYLFFFSVELYKLFQNFLSTAFSHF